MHHLRFNCYHWLHHNSKTHAVVQVLLTRKILSFNTEKTHFPKASGEKYNYFAYVYLVLANVLHDVYARDLIDQ